MFAVKTEILKELLESPEWRQKLERAETSAEVEKVLADFCIAKGYKIKQFPA